MCILDTLPLLHATSRLFTVWKMNFFPNTHNSVNSDLSHPVRQFQYLNGTWEVGKKVKFPHCAIVKVQYLS